ncbi:MAG TPA: TIGR01458 family HAD-type hydrolase [Persephonella sp.]|uniref:Haloacid dehalogenase-like hydrolase domain-containing protein 2 n=1 Tax=Persephonella marina (strain DSM 14350 / EX-H1) TaxID=123214 RepID=C0QPX0_PERMH|nr:MULTISPECIES: TIGR01458 family HAD-type hydrolase [Persephonella]ACO03393.1 HAD-superfamily subfamily IIA hydrolase [Persephonella marina EX-H1]HCB69669.1 TIGR01458 family HAD-type hydrolase [Persephonella sp.]
MLENIKGLLLDLDGVLYIVDRPIEGAQETLKKLRERFKVVFITNTTTKPKKVVYQKLIEMGFDLNEDEIFSALEATKQFIKEKGGGAYLLLTDLAKKDFEDIPSEPVNYVVIGDARENFSYENMNKAFRYIMDGAQIIAAAKNKYFMDRDGKLSLDCGAFVVGLEFATGKEALIIGKPSKDFFLLAVRKMGLKPEEVAVIGDDIEADVKGGMDAGLKGILVKTGKFTQDDLKKGIKPDLILDSINQILEYI